MGNKLGGVIRSKRGAILWGLSLVLFANTGFMSYILLKALLLGGFRADIVGGIATIALCFVFGWLGVSFFSTSVEVTKTSVAVSSLFGRRQVQFKDTLEVRITPLYGDTIFFGFNVLLINSDGSTLPVRASFYGNRHQLLKAIMEGMCLASGVTIFDSALTRAYGHPPYGIFKSKESL